MWDLLLTHKGNRGLRLDKSAITWVIKSGERSPWVGVHREWAGNSTLWQHRRSENHFCPSRTEKQGKPYQITLLFQSVFVLKRLCPVNQCLRPGYGLTVFSQVYQTNPNQYTGKTKPTELIRVKQQLAHYKISVAASSLILIRSLS